MPSLLPQLRQLIQILTASWRVNLEPPIPADELAASREAASIPSFGFFFLLTASTIIASLGLMADSAAVIIGAMIVAPLMNPILSLAYAIVTANWGLYCRSIVTMLLGSLLTVLLAALLVAVSPFSVAGPEVLARSSPNLIDLGIALAAGAAGAFSLTRQSIASSIAGVAIAVALVPPLCVVGIGVGVGTELAGSVGYLTITNLEVARGASLLFLANLVGIVIAASAVFLCQSYGSLQHSFKSLSIWVLLALLLSRPLSDALHEFAVGSRIRLELHRIQSSSDGYPLIQVRYIGIRVVRGAADVMIVGTAPEGYLSDDSKLKIADERIFRALQPLGISSMDITFSVAPVEIFNYRNLTTSSP